MRAVARAGYDEGCLIGIPPIGFPNKGMVDMNGISLETSGNVLTTDENAAGKLAGDQPDMSAGSASSRHATQYHPKMSAR